MNRTILYVMLGITVLALCFLLKEIFVRILEKKRFRGETFVEGVFMSFLLSYLLPPEGSHKNRVIHNKIFMLDSTKGIRDFYVIRILSVIFFFVISLAIVTTNCIDRKTNVYEVTKDQPLQISSSAYRTLADGVTFKSKNYEEDVALVDKNKFHLSEKSDRAKFQEIIGEDLYKSISVIHSRETGVFTLFDLLILVGVSFFGWWLPLKLLIMSTRYLYSIMFFEFDRLETLIYMNCDDKVVNILDLLLKDSVAFREFFRAFINLYDSEEMDAYEQILSQETLPDYFTTLIRYLQMVDTSGSSVVMYEISANKDLNEDKLKDELDHVLYKRKGKINMLCGLSLVAGIIFMVWSVISSFDFSSLSGI